MIKISHYIYGLKSTNPDGTEWWIVHNYKRKVSCSSELACWKIIDLCGYVEGKLTSKPINHKTLESKAEFLLSGRHTRRKELVERGDQN